MAAGIETATIDIAPLFASPGGPAPELDERVGTALREEGAFLATGFSGAAGLGRQLGHLLGFFALPEAAKLPLSVHRYRAASQNLYRGYYPLPDGPHWSYNEIFDIGPEPPLAVPDLPGAAAFREANVWPAEADLPGWRRAMLAFSDTCRSLSLAVVGSAARGLRLEPEPLLAPCVGRNATLRLLHYPPIPPGFELRGRDGEEVEREVDGRRVIARPHVDTGLLSIIWQDGLGGLEVQGSDGIWRAVPARPDALSIHCGDLLAGPSGGALRATPHRVLSGQGARRSIGFFLEPDFTTAVLPPDGAGAKSYAAHLIDEFPARFVPPEGELTAREAG